MSDVAIYFILLTSAVIRGDHNSLSPRSDWQGPPAEDINVYNFVHLGHGN